MKGANIQIPDIQILDKGEFKKMGNLDTRIEFKSIPYDFSFKMQESVSKISSSNLGPGAFHKINFSPAGGLTETSFGENKTAHLQIGVENKKIGSLFFTKNGWGGGAPGDKAEGAYVLYKEDAQQNITTMDKSIAASMLSSDMRYTPKTIDDDVPENIVGEGAWFTCLDSNYNERHTVYIDFSKFIDEGLVGKYRLRLQFHCINWPFGEEPLLGDNDCKPESTGEDFGIEIQWKIEGNYALPETDFFNME